MKKILIIEDDMAISYMLADPLTSYGYAVRQAANGREGLDMLEDRLPDLILCDVMLPILDGRVVCKHIRATPRFQSIPLVMIVPAKLICPNAHTLAFSRNPLTSRRCSRSVGGSSAPPDPPCCGAIAKR